MFMFRNFILMVFYNSQYTQYTRNNMRIEIVNYVVYSVFPGRSQSKHGFLPRLANLYLNDIFQLHILKDHAKLFLTEISYD